MWRAWLGLWALAAVAVAQEPISARLFLRPSEQVLAPQQGSAYWVHEELLRAVCALPVQELQLSDFPIAPGEWRTLHLRRAPLVVDGETEWWVGISPARPGKPEEQRRHRGIVHFAFRGEIVGEEGSSVWLNIVGGELYGLIRRGTQQLVGIMPTGQQWGAEREHVLGEHTGAQLWEWVCLTRDEVETKPEPLPRPQQFSPLLRVRVAVETTTPLYQRLQGNLERVYNYITALFAMVSRIYEDEVNVTFYLPWVQVWAAPPDGQEDPYQNDSDISALLGEVTTYWNTYRTNVRRDLVHVVTAPGATMVGGIARLNTLCQESQAYSVSGIQASYRYPTLSYTWDVHVVAHEIGHVFGAPHTHACTQFWTPPLDTCVTRDDSRYPTPDACYSAPVRPTVSPGSIMSYCHLYGGRVAMTFLPVVANVIRTRRAQSCLIVPPRPTVLIQHPVGNQTFRARDTVQIRWTSYQVSAVNIEYSVDSMGSWNRIASSVPAGDRVYAWRIPNENYPAVWLRVYDVTNPITGDTTMASFAIEAPTLQLTYPVGGERFGQRERVGIFWTATLLNAVNIYFSADGGSRWDTVALGVTGQSYMWTIPTVVTDRARIRITDASNLGLSTESGPFSIGVPVLRLLQPNGGETWRIRQRYEIRWESEFVSRIRIDYSVDSGQTWRMIRASYDADTGRYVWTVPNTPTNRALVRLQNLGIPDQVVQSAGVFTIADTIIGVREPWRSSGLQLQLVPSVVQGQWVWLKLTTPEPLPRLQVQLRTLLGSECGEPLRWSELPAGEHVLTVPVPATLANGLYWVELVSTSGRWVLPLQLVR